MIKSAAIVKSEALAPWKKLRLEKRKLKKEQAAERKATKQIRPSPIGKRVIEVMVEQPEVMDAPPTREELEAKAIELGIKFDGRTKDKKLGQLIEDKLGE